MTEEISKIVKKLSLIPHPEGGFYRETYRSKELIPKNTLNNTFSGDRNYCTSIYFLLTSDNFSAFHRIKQDEVWHFYAGSPLHIHVIDTNGKYIRYTIGSDIENGKEPQLTVPGGCWFASSVKEKNSFSFVGCTVAPGFDFDDFELADRDKLINDYPEHHKIITQLTR